MVLISSWSQFYSQIYDCFSHFLYKFSVFINYFNFCSPNQRFSVEYHEYNNSDYISVRNIPEYIKKVSGTNYYRRSTLLVLNETPY